MAKWGEGDPRWIVEERPDAKNVNNWHWTEKNATQWSKDTLQDLLNGLQIEDGPICVTISEIKKCTGEATANNRKAKLIFFYEWELDLKWKAKVSGSDDEIEGTIEIPNLSDEHAAHEVDVTPSCSASGSGAHEDKVMHLLRHKGTDLIRDRLNDYIQALKTEYSKDLVLPTKQMAQVTVNPHSKTQINKKAFQDSTVAASKPASSAAADCTEEMREFKLKETFKTTPDQLYNVFTNQELCERWTNGPCCVDATVGKEFTLFKGMVTGKFTKVDPNKSLVMDWRLKSYPDGHFARICLQFVDVGDATELRLAGRRVPRSQLDQTTAGWQNQYFSNIMRAFGFGARLF